MNNPPPHIEAELQKLGVMPQKPKNPTSSSKPADHKPTPWKPEYAGQEPPF